MLIYFMYGMFPTLFCFPISIIYYSDKEIIYCAYNNLLFSK